MSIKEYIRQLGIPGLISGLSLLSAWFAIYLLLTNHLKYSVALAFLAFVLDTLDGYAARRLKKVSELGRQLDSMIDLINYSVYSALIVVLVLIPNVLGVLVGFFIVFFGVLRLIRFNLEGYISDNSATYYRGVVVCHISLVAISLLLITSLVEIHQIIIATVFIVLSLMQLSNFRTRKTSTLRYWYVVGLALVSGAFVWLP